MKPENIATYHKFLFDGGYLIARLFIIRLETLPKKDNARYDFASLVNWHDEDDQKLLTSCLEREFDDIKDIYFLMEHLTKVLNDLPRGQGSQINMRFGLGTKPREDGITAHKLKKTILPSLIRAMDAYDKKEYDFEEEGIKAAKHVLDIVETAKISELMFHGPYAKEAKKGPTKQYPIENAIEIASIFRKKSDLIQQICDDTVNEFTTAFDEETYSPSLNMSVKVEKLEKNYRIYAEILPHERKNTKFFFFDLYVDDNFKARSEEPSFMLPVETDAHVVRIEKVPKSKIGETIKPTINTIGSIVKLSVEHYPVPCKYQLIRGGKILRTAPTPEFILKDHKGPLEDYRIRLIKNDDAIDSMLQVKKNFYDKKSNLERRTLADNSNNIIMDMFITLKTMETIEKEFPSTFQNMLKYRKTDNLKHRVETFWILSALCLPQSL